MIVCVFACPVLKIKNFEMQTFWFAPTLGAIILLIFGLVDANVVFSSMIENSSVNPLEILVLFISMVFLSVVLDEVGFFKYLATLAVKKAKNSQFAMFIILFFMVSILTIFTSNDIIVITFTPFIIFFCKNTKISPIPYLVAEFVAANTWSMLLIIGNPTNIYLATSFNIDFFTYIKYMFIPTIFDGITSLLIMLLIFKNKLKQKLDSNISSDHILDKNIFIISLILLIICIVLLAISSFINLSMWIISLTSAGILLIFLVIYCIFNKDKRYILKESIFRLPFNLIPLLLSMFVIVLTLHQYDITTYIFNLLNTSQPILTFGLSSFVFANLTNNIPMSILYVDVIKNFTNISPQAIYSSIISSNIAAYFTPIGALAGIMWMSILRKNDVEFSFLKFSIYGSIIAIPTLLVSLGGLYISFLF